MASEMIATVEEIIVNVSSRIQKTKNKSIYNIYIFLNYFTGTEHCCDLVTLYIITHTYR